MAHCRKLIGDALGQIRRVEEKAAWGRLAGKSSIWFASMATSIAGAPLLP
jgi:hypothetical protein